MRRVASRLWSALRRMVGARVAERGLDDELRSYLQHEIDARIAGGMPANEAGRTALVELGGVEQVKERVRDARTGAWLDGLFRDVVHAARALVKAPQYSTGIIASLGIGVAGVVAGVALVNGVLFRPFPGVGDPDRLVELEVLVRNPGVFQSGRPPGWRTLRTSTTDYDDRIRTLREGLGSLDGLASATWAEVPVMLPQARSLEVGLVSASYFDVLGVRLELGRGFRPEEDQFANASVAVIGHGLWVRELGADPAVVGRYIQIGRHSAQIVGVTSRGFSGINRRIGYGGVELWLPMALADAVSRADPDEPPSDEPGERWVTYIGRLGPVADAARVQAELDVLAPRLVSPDGAEAAMGSVSGLSLADRPTAGALIGLVLLPVLVLLVGCANASILLLARASGRGREIAVRAAIGASRARLVRQLLVESLLLALVATVAALPLAWAGLRLAATFLLVPTPIDATVLATALATAVVTALGFGIVPALRASSVSPARVLGTASDGDGTPRRSLGRRVLVGAQVAVSLALLAGSTQMVSTLEDLGGSAGVDPDRLLVAAFDLEQLGFAPTESEPFYDRLLQRVSQLPGVEAAGLAYHTLLWKDRGGMEPRNAVVVWQPRVEAEFARSQSGGYVGGEFFQALGLEVLDGRGFTASDRSGRPRVALVTEALVTEYFGGDAIGRALRVSAGGQDETQALDVRIVGIVEAARDPGYLRQKPMSAVFLPARLRDEPALTLYVRSRDSAAALAPAVRAIVQDIDARVPIIELASLDAMNEARYSMERGLAGAAELLGVLALLLAAVGLFGVTSYVVSVRTREIAVRMALGARAHGVLTMLLRQALVTVLIGSLVGGIAAAVVGAIGRAGVLGAAGVDSLTLGWSATLLAASMLTATLIPALRAARLDPMVVLRHD